MRHALLILTLMAGLMAASYSTALASRGGDQGYGVVVGIPTGVTAKIWLDDAWAVDGTAGVIGGDLDMHLAFLFHNFSWYGNMSKKPLWLADLTEKADLPFYYGIGPRVLFRDDSELGLRFPLGLSCLPKNSNWEIFAEFAPVMRLTPCFGFNGDIGMGVRYYFQPIRPRESEKN